MDKMNHFKGALKVFANYCTFDIIFVVFLSIVIGLAKEGFLTWLPLYSGIVFALMALTLYIDMKGLAAKEKRPQYNLNPYPLKGLVLGAIGFLPFILLELVYPFLHFSDVLLDRIKHLALNTLLGPVYVFIRLVRGAGGGDVVAYAAASLIVPLIAMLGYLAGYYNFDLRTFLRIPVKKPPAPKFKSSYEYFKNSAKRR